MILYKYRSYNFETGAKKWTSKIIKNQELFFAGIESFNDPFDGKVLLRYDGKLNEIKAAQVRVQYDMNLSGPEKKEGIPMSKSIELIDNRISQEFIDNKRLNEGRLIRIQKMHNEKGILALSTKNNNILMWSHYSDNHYGICFGFECGNDSLSDYKRVRYQTHYDDIWSWLHTDSEILERILYSKSIDWQYEDEYRIVKDKIGSEKYVKSNLKEVIFGALMSAKEKLEIVSLCSKNGLSPSFKEAQLDVESYQINIIDYKS